MTNQVDKSEAYKREIDALRVADQHRHRHILPLLASYSRPRNGAMEYYLIFPQARCNLMNLWEEHTGPPFDGVIFTWMLSQCHGLVHALVQIHHESKDSAVESAVWAAWGYSPSLHPGFLPMGQSRKITPGRFSSPTSKMPSFIPRVPVSRNTASKKQGVLRGGGIFVSGVLFAVVRFLVPRGK